MMEGDIISAHHMVLRDTDQSSTMDKLYDFHGGE